MSKGKDETPEAPEAVVAEATGATTTTVACPCHDTPWTTPSSMDDMPIPAVRAWAAMVRAYKERADLDVHVENAISFVEGALGPRQWRTFERQHTGGQMNGMVNAIIAKMNGEASPGER